MRFHIIQPSQLEHYKFNAVQNENLSQVVKLAVGMANATVAGMFHVGTRLRKSSRFEAVSSTDA